MGEDTRRMLIAVTLSFALMFGWQYFFPNKKASVQTVVQNITAPVGVRSFGQTNSEALPKINYQNIPKVNIETPSLKGSISTLGLRIENLFLLNHKDKIGLNAQPIKLFGDLLQFVEVKFCSADPLQEVPNFDTLWSANSKNLTTETPVEFSWINSKGVKFLVNVSLDKNYLFTFKTSVKNNSKEDIVCSPCVHIVKNKHLIEDEINKSSHSGSTGAINKQIKEYSYKKLLEEGKKDFETDAFVWFGMNDKYWLTAVIAEKPISARVEIAKLDLMGSEYMSNLISCANKEIKSGSSIDSTLYLFAGAKQVRLLDEYRDSLGALLLDRAIDFSWLYFITKPLFYVLNFFFGLVKNFGVSIIMLTLVVRIAMFGLALKSEGTVRKMKELQPKMQRLKELYKGDQERLRKEIMDLYRREKISPVGCLPMLAQAPVFFSVYKVLDVTLELRHAPFFLWISDLSTRDSTNIFTLFGLLPWNPPSFLHMGIWPILMALSMYLQQRISPKPDDPVQAKMFAIMPLIMLFVLGNSPAGLVIYWTWSNCFGIGQQYLLNFLAKRRLKS